MQNQRIRIRPKAFDHRLIGINQPRKSAETLGALRAGSRSDPAADLPQRALLMF